MLKNYLKISLRHLQRNRAYTIINVLGLTIGIAVCTIIFLIINKELKYDKFHDNYNKIYRINGVSENASGKEFTAKTPYPLKEALATDFSDLKQVTRFHFDSENTVQVEDNELYNEENIVFADSSLFEVLDFGGGTLQKVIQGNFKRAMAQPGSVFLSESYAKKYFSGGDPIGKAIKLGNSIEAEVKGIFKDIPETSHLTFNILVSYPSLTEEFIGGFDMNTYGVVISGFHYILLPENMNKAQAEQRLNQIADKYYADTKDSEGLILQHLSDIHFNMVYANDNPGETVDRVQLMTLAFIALFIIGIASINFINLATAIGIKRAREVGIRKVLGASKKELIFQHLGEAFIITFLSMLLALGIAERITPHFNEFAGKNISLDFVGNPMLIVFLGILLLAVSLLSGIYPALVLSSYKPAKALKSKFNSTNKTAVILRRGLVIFQFGIAQTLIIGAVIISRQLDYFQEKPLGFEKGAILNLDIPEPADSVKRMQFYNQVNQLGNVDAVSFNLGAPTSGNNLNTIFSFPEVDTDINYDVGLKIADSRYKETYGIELVAGKWFTLADDESSEVKFVVNETLVKKLGFNEASEAIGKEIKTGINDIKAEIIGVVKDFHSRSLHAEIPPIILVKFQDFYYNAGIKFNGGQLQNSLRSIEQIWREIYPGYFFNYNFMDETVEKLYKKEKRIFNVSQFFAGIAIFIGCLGLLGLSSFMVNQRKKEIGVRKVLGASNASIIFLFSKEFLKLLLIAFVVAAPVAWYFMDVWLADFAYRIKIGVDIFVLTIILSAIAALATVGFQSIKVAFESPVKSLKSE